MDLTKQDRPSLEQVEIVPVLLLFLHVIKDDFHLAVWLSAVVQEEALHFKVHHLLFGESVQRSEVVPQRLIQNSKGNFTVHFAVVIVAVQVAALA